jgi:paraquat-inducible protein B
MSEKPHSVAIGAFIVGALLILISALLFISGSGLGRDRETVVMVFDGSVKGLSIGATVALRGVQIGQVTDIKLIFDSDSIDLIMLVEAQVSGDRIQRQGRIGGDFTEELIGQGLRAQLIPQSLLTGLLLIQLDFHPGSDLNLGQIDSPYIQIPTVPTDLERFTREVESIDFAQVASDLQTIVAGLSRFTNSENLQAFPVKLEESMLSLRNLSDQLRAQLETTGPRLDALLDNTNSAVVTLNRELPRLSSATRDSLTRAEAAMRSFEQAAQEARDMIATDSPTTYQLNKALRELELAGTALQALAKTLDEQPEALIRGKRYQD